MSKEELKKFGELQQEDDLEIAKMCRPRLDIKRRWELDKNWTNKPQTKEEIEKNQIVLSKYRLKNKRIHLKQNGITIHERDFNNVKFEEEKLENLKKDIENKIEFNQNLEIKNNEELENISKMSEQELKKRINKKEIEQLDEQIKSAKKQGGASEMVDLINKKVDKKSDIDYK